MNPPLPLFDDNVCALWEKKFNPPKIKQTCCLEPNIIKFTAQKRAIDEMPTCFNFCTRCNKIVH